MRAPLISLLLVMTLRLTVAEFVALQRLHPHELREHLELPASCEPALFALRARPRGKVTVLVRCVEPEDPSEAEPAT
jgi:hypothetical protein